MLYSLNIYEILANVNLAPMGDYGGDDGGIALSVYESLYLPVGIRRKT